MCVWLEDLDVPMNCVPGRLEMEGEMQRIFYMPVWITQCSVFVIVTLTKNIKYVFLPSSRGVLMIPPLRRLQTVMFRLT